MTTPPGRLQGRIAIVSGSSSGLGQAISLALAAEGASIFCIDLHATPRAVPTVPSAGAPVDPNMNPNINPRGSISGSATSGQPGTHERIRQLGGEATFHKADVTSAREMELAVRACVQRYRRVDIMVNNAGVSVESGHSPRALRAHETSEEDYDRTMAVNAKGVFLGCKYALKQMLEQPPRQDRGDGLAQAQPQQNRPGSSSSSSRGWVINVASVQGLVPFYGTPSYCASKGAVVMLTRQIALDYARDRIHCNALCPGFLDTGMTINLQSSPDALADIQAKHPFGGKLGSVEDVARAAVFLASDDAAWITGVPLPVDGGYLLR